MKLFQFWLRCDFWIFIIKEERRLILWDANIHWFVSLRPSLWFVLWSCPYRRNKQWLICFRQIIIESSRTHDYSSPVSLRSPMELGHTLKKRKGTLRIVDIRLRLPRAPSFIRKRQQRLSIPINVSVRKNFSDFRKWVTFLPEPVILYSKVDSQKL